MRTQLRKKGLHEKVVVLISPYEK